MAFNAESTIQDIIKQHILSPEEMKRSEDDRKAAKEKQSRFIAEKIANFKPEFEHCEIHGKFQISWIDDEGAVGYSSSYCRKCEKINQVERMFNNSNLSPRFKNADFESYEIYDKRQEKALGVCKSFADNFEKILEKGSTLIMLGKSGTGKNHLATAISKVVISNGHSVVRVKMWQFLNEYWAKAFDEKNNFIKELGKVDLVIIDEIGKASDSAAAQNALFALIDERYEQIKPTILITNLDKTGLADAIGSAAFDRCATGTILSCEWGSFRSK